MRFYRTTTLVLIGCLALFGCKKKEEAAPPPAAAPEASTAPQTSVETTPATVAFKVTSIDLGKAVGPDKKITDPVTTFGPKDTIFEDGVLGTERGDRIGDLLVRPYCLAQVDRGDLERHGGRGGLHRRLRSGRGLRRGSRRRRGLLLLLAAEQREAADEDQGRGAIEAHGFSPLSH